MCAGIAKPPETYAEMTHGSPFWLVRYAHQARLRAAAKLIFEEQPRLLIDFGAGDGEFLASMIESGRKIERAIAYDPWPEMRELSQARLEPLLGEQVTVCGDFDEVIEALDGAKADALTCLEVLEHLDLPERLRFYGFCRTVLGPGGRAVIGVPVEVGPTLLVKQLGRRLLKGRPQAHRPGELALKIAGRRTRDPQRFDPDSSGDYIFDHKGFDYRVFGEELEEHTEILGTSVSPLGGPPWMLNQEIFFSARPR